MARQSPLWIVFAMLLAGCGAAPDETDDQTPDDEASAGAASIDAPSNWTVGRWFVYDVVDSQGERSQTGLVVAADQGATWLLETTTRRTAAFEAEFDISFVGAIGRDDRSGSQQGTKVEYFRWPMVEGSNWTTPWDGVQRRVVVEALVDDAEATLRAYEGDRVAVEYTYLHSLGFFSAITFYQADGSAQFANTLNSFGDDFSGNIVHATVETILDRATVNGPATSESADYQVPQGTNETELRIGLNCTDVQGSWRFTFAPLMRPPEQADQTYRRDGACPIEETSTHLIDQVIPAAWQFAGQFTAPTDQFIGHSFKVVAITYEELPFPPP